MEWLDVSVFTNWNLSSVTSSNIYTRDGFHLATYDEVFELFLNAGIGYIFDRTGNLDHGETADGEVYESRVALRDLYEKLSGGPENFGGNGDTFINGVLAYDDNDGKMNLASLSADKQQTLINSSSDAWGPPGSYSYIGAWYVREMSQVPTPATLGMFALGLMAFMPTAL
ncbi:PEP-CTERM sorting domain-containing protein [Thalassomonas sp. RHCl1]|uniref:PEP-CTERM sorting domain-containing protein n=1 Tax=Thalassomonas sp. RHCl1 TaxID=2995320 RepID=UPI00248BC0AC|nr:PEP-CTERM sorting domain-containing protein [Thalassomonas sp. RHCl1]